ncbi:MAG: porin family protein [Bauldia sp.]|nr:porin family protein [Bauldia sp.]
MRKYAAAIVASVGLSGIAVAADTPPPLAPPAPPPVYVEPPAVIDWTGPYAGMVAGWGWGSFADGITAPLSGAVAGAFTGYNFQRGRFVLGTEFDFMWSNRTDGGTNAVNWSGNGRGRLGYLVTDSILVYGTGGVAVGGSFTAVSSYTTEIGWTAGGGIEIGNSIVFGRLEYLYANYGSVTGAGATTLSTQEVRAGVGIRFW